MNKIGTIYYLKKDPRKNLKVIGMDGDQLGLIPNIIGVLDGEMYLRPSPWIIWVTEEELLKLYSEQ